MQVLIEDVVGLFGLLLVVAGVGWAYPPAGVVVLGLILTGGAALWSRRRPRRPES